MIGAVLLDNSRLAVVRGIVGADDFHDPRHATVWESVCALADEGEPVDVVTLARHLRERSKLNSVGGAQFLGELTDSIPTLAHVESHAGIVAQLAGVRAMLAATKGAEEAIRHGEPTRAADLLRAAVVAVDDRKRGSRLTAMDDAVVAAFEAFEARVLNGGVDPSARSTGYPALDDMLGGGVRGGEQVVIGSRPSVGKTALVLGMAEAIAEWSREQRPENPWPVLFFALEMPTREMVGRLLVRQSGMDNERWRRGVADAGDMRALTEAGNRVAGLPIQWCDKSGMTLRAILAECRRVHTRHGGLAAVVVDYLGLVKNPRESRQQEIGEISREFKAHAKEYACPFLTAAQLNRESEKGTTPQKPTLAQLREAGDVEQDADVVMLLHRQEHALRTRGLPVPPEAKGRGEIIVAKQRNGPCEVIVAEFDGPRMAWRAPRPSTEGAIPPSAYGGDDDDFPVMEGFER